MKKFFVGMTNSFSLNLGSDIVSVDMLLRIFKESC